MASRPLWRTTSSPTGTASNRHSAAPPRDSASDDNSASVIAATGNAAEEPTINQYASMPRGMPLPMIASARQ
ncbi:hypothetical protein D3C73_1175910 [compost metagenome]